MNKYNAQKTTVFGQTFDSRKEAERYLVLRSMEKAGVISDLQRQVKYELTKPHGKKRARYYIADFVYKKNGDIVVEDVKGYRKGAAYALFSLKAAVMYDKYGIEVVEV